MKKDLIIVGLSFCLLIKFRVSIKNSYRLSKLEKELKDTIEVVYWLNDKLLIAEDNILNKEEKKHYVSEIEFKLGIRNKHLEVLKDIEAGMADIDDLN